MRWESWEATEERCVYSKKTLTVIGARVPLYKRVCVSAHGALWFSDIVHRRDKFRFAFSAHMMVAPCKLDVFF